MSGDKGSGSDKITGDGETLNGSNFKTGNGTRCYFLNCEYHLLPKCPQLGRFSTGTVPALSPPRAPTRVSYSSFSLGSAGEVKDGGLLLQKGNEEPREKSCSATSELLGSFSVADADSVVLRDAGATTHVACFEWLFRFGEICGSSGASVFGSGEIHVL